MKLTKPTPDQINAAVAEYVAGWKRIKEAANITFEIPSTGARGTPPPFATSADAVLPLLENGEDIAQIRYLRYSTGRYAWEVSLNSSFSGSGETFPFGLCIALLRAHGVEVEFTP
jgi:hypothetical protein